MSFDVMRVRLHLRGVRVTGVVVDTPHRVGGGGGFCQEVVVVSVLWSFVSAGS